MIRLIPFILLISININCIGKKAKLVTLQKEIKDSLSQLKNDYRVNLLVRSVKMEDSFRILHPDWERFNLLKDAVMMDTLNYKLSDEMQDMSHQIKVLENIYDSLEFEIKKY